MPHFNELRSQQTSCELAVPCELRMHEVTGICFPSSQLITAGTSPCEVPSRIAGYTECVIMSCGTDPRTVSVTRTFGAPLASLPNKTSARYLRLCPWNEMATVKEA